MLFFMSLKDRKPSNARFWFCNWSSSFPIGKLQFPYWRTRVSLLENYLAAIRDKTLTIIYTRRGTLQCPFVTYICFG